MEYRALGKTGLRVSVLGFGAGNVGGLMVRGTETERRRAIERAIEAGITYFDTAPVYGDGRSEETLGQALRELGADVLVGTKVNLAEDERADPAPAIRRALEASLGRLGSDRVDLFQLHNRVVTAAPSDGSDPRSIPLDTVLGPIADGLRAVREAGLTRFIGLTGLGEPEALHRVAESDVFDTIQCYVNALNPSAGWTLAQPPEQDFRGLAGRAADNGMGVIAIRVLAAGALANQSDRHQLAGDPGAPIVRGAAYDADLERAGSLGHLASELGLEGPPELSLRLVQSNPGISTALVGYSDIGQLEDAIRWTERGPLDPSAIERILAAAGA
jgi:aryl-alcohol dehydrogenase-like predicted oxidoreductase